MKINFLHAAAAFILVSMTAASGLPELEGHEFVYNTDFSEAAESFWNLGANEFVSHAQTPVDNRFRPPTGSEVVDNVLTFGNNGSAILDITNANVLGESFTVGEDTAAAYLRVRLTGTNVLFSVGLGNEEAMSAEPESIDVRVAGGSLRVSGNPLRSAGVKRDFNNLGDPNPPETISGSQITDPLPETVFDEIFDMAVLWEENTIRVYTRPVGDEPPASWALRHSHTFSLGEDMGAGEVEPYASSDLVIYMPADGTLEIFEFAVSIPEPPPFLITSPMINNGDFTFSFSSEENMFYQIQYTLSLLSGEEGWQTLADYLNIAGDGSEITVEDEATEDIIFYRVAVSSEPFPEE